MKAISDIALGQIFDYIWPILLCLTQLNEYEYLQ